MNPRIASIAAAMLFVLIGGSQNTVRAAIVYSNDFSSNANGFDASTRVMEANDGSSQSSPTGSSLFLGPFSGNGNANLTLNGLTIGAQYSLQFDLKIAESWDGNSTSFGPDRWSLTTVNTSNPTLVDTTFVNLVPSDGGLNNFTQNYADNNLIGSGANAAFTGADVARTNAVSASIFDRYAIYYFGHGAGNPVLTFTANNSTATLHFAGFSLQGESDEYWAIDNVVVSTADTTSTTPEPASLAIWGLGALGCSIGAYRRRKLKS
jgi:hypothetical protein